MIRKDNGSAQLDSQVAETLLREMTTGKYRDVDRLPPEVTVAEEIGVSRTALRDGCSILEREGFITRKWGHGTMINRHVFSVRNRIDLENEFLDMVRHYGYEAECTDVSSEWIKATPHIAARLNLSVGDEVLQIRRTIRADGVPAIFCIDSLDASLFPGREIPEELRTAPVFALLDEVCGLDVFMDVSEIHAVNADGEIAKKLAVPEGTAVLHLDEVGYSVNGHPILLSLEYYRENIITHSIIRKKI